MAKEHTFQDSIKEMELVAEGLNEGSMLNNTTVGVTRVTLKQLQMKLDNLPDVVWYCNRDYYFWYYLSERPFVSFEGAVYISEPDALLFVTVKEPT